MSAMPELPADVLELKARVAAFVRDELHPWEERIASTGVIERTEVEAAKRKARAAGLSMLNMPVEYGGRDISVVAQVALEEETGKATNGIGFIANDRGPRELLEMATPEQIERYVRPVIEGETMLAWALTEPGAGSDVSAISTTARREGDEWVLDGEKWFATDADVAGFYIVLADAGGEQALFLVDSDNPGARITRLPEFMHDPYISKHAEIKFEGCRVPASARVPGGGAEGARKWFVIERLFIAARACGTAQRCIDLAREWALERVAFGRPIAEHQAIQFSLADSLTELLAARLLTYHAAEEMDRGADGAVVHGKVSMAKLYASEMVGRVADRCLQIMGGRGFMTENPVNRYYREVRVDRIWEGTSEIQRVIIGRGLLKRGAGPYLS